MAGFLGRATQNSPAMLVEGEIGIGKTSVLAAARDAAREHGWLVLTANPAELEMPLEYTGIADLLDPLPGSLTETLPGPQRRAIRVALLREEAPDRRWTCAPSPRPRSPCSPGRPPAARSHDRR